MGSLTAAEENAFKVSERVGLEPGACHWYDGLWKGPHQVASSI